MARSSSAVFSIRRSRYERNEGIVGITSVMPTGGPVRMGRHAFGGATRGECRRKRTLTRPTTRTTGCLGSGEGSGNALYRRRLAPDAPRAPRLPFHGDAASLVREAQLPGDSNA